MASPVVFDRFVDVPVRNNASRDCNPSAAVSLAGPTSSVDVIEAAGSDCFVRVHISGGGGTVAAEDESTTAARGDGVCLLLVHGAGGSARTWHYLVRLFQGTSADIVLVAPDLRGHGGSSAANTMTSRDLTDDIFRVLDALSDVIGSRRIVLIGHSLGGAIVARVAAERRASDNIAAVIVLDVAEETVIDSFKFLEKALRLWPTAFASQEDYVRWTVSMRRPSSSHSATISTTDHLVADVHGRLRMKFDLLEWKDSWVDWFRGFDAAFLSLGMPSLLIMAHYDNLDTALSVGQMQGKFECQIMSSPLRSHFIQEDSPDELFTVLMTFLRKRGFVSMDAYNELMVSARRNRIF